MRPEPHNEQSLELELAQAKTKDAALQLLFEETERALAQLKLTKNPAEKTRVSNEAKSLLSRAESIKATGVWKHPAGTPSRPSSGSIPIRLPPQSTRQQTKAEQIIILKGSFVNGCKFPPWKSSPLAADFEASKDGESFEDATHFRLSQTQQDSLEGWLRPSDRVPAVSAAYSPPKPQQSAAPLHSGLIDLVQDAATDCSVVASMCAIVARASHGHAMLLKDVFFPYDDTLQLPAESSNARYIAKLNFNGASRRVEVDDRLPVSKADRINYVTDRNHPGVIWPALLEKMYLKVRGGYDFPGSNSSTDLWVLTGWIPEQIFLESDDVFPSDIWVRIWKAHVRGDVMLTIGTGKLSFKVESALGLTSEHNYAVLNLRETEGRRQLLVKNPWVTGRMWQRESPVSATSPQVVQTNTVESSQNLLHDDHDLVPGAFWMDFQQVVQHFESIYLNWNPALYSHRQDTHFTWNHDIEPLGGTYFSNPQFAISIESGGTGCALLNRHFSGEPDSRETSTSSAADEHFVRLLLFDAGGKRIALKGNSQASTPFVASHHTLLHLEDLRPGSTYTLVVDQESQHVRDQTFSLCLFAKSAISVEKATPLYPFSATLESAWTERNSGGNAGSPLFSKNPQFRIAMSKPTALSVTLIGTDQSIAVNVKICFSEGKRIHDVRSRDVMADSSDYRPACAQASKAKLEPGIYTIVCSTWEVGQYDKFVLRVDSDHIVQLAAFPHEDAGLLRTLAPDATFSHDEEAQAILLLPQCLTKLILVIKHKPAKDSTTSERSERSMIRASIRHGNAFQHRILASNSEHEFRDSLGGVRIDGIDLSPAMTRTSDLWLVLDRNGTARKLEDEVFSVELFTETAAAIQTGGWQEWEEI